MSWLAPTLAGEPVPAAPDRVYAPGDKVRCECGRTVQAQMMTPVPGALAALIKRSGTTHVCDGCRNRWIRTGRISGADLRAALGAPAEIVARIRTREGP